MIRKLCYKKILFFLALLFTGLSLFCQEIEGTEQAAEGDPAALSKKEPAVVKIISARKTEYKKDASDDSDLILFTGDVSLSVTQGSSVLSIEADTVTFNRSKSLLYAEGSVKFGTKGGASASDSDIMTASSLLLNTETQEGFFNAGKIVQGNSGAINLSSGTKLIISSDLFVKGNSGTVTFKDGILTFCDEEDPHWKIKASRIWLLPGNEFGFLNALLYIGHIPVMYFPFFYYPKDEMIFNPTFSYDPRKGYSIQTTTYLIGRKKLANSSSDNDISNFLKPTELKKQVREGLFLRNLDQKDTAPSSFLKVMADFYSNLGYLAGVQGVFKPSDVISDISFATYMGWSTSIFPAADSKYTTFYNSKEYSDSSWFFGTEFPFRFYVDFSMKMNFSPFSLNISLPLYSDPYFKSDFLNRNEDMDWIDFLINNPVMNGKSKSSSSSSSSDAYSWSVSGSVSTPSFVKNLNPYIKDLSVKELSSKINFSTKNNSDLRYPFSTVSPERSFFYPSTAYPFKITLSLSGSLLSSSDSASRPQTNSEYTYFLPDELDDSKKADEDEGTEEPSGDSLEDATGEAPAAGNDDVSDAMPEEPVLEEIPEYMLRNQGGLNLAKSSKQVFSYGITYSLNPSFSTESHFSADSFSIPEEVKFSDTDTFFVSFKSPLAFDGNVSWGGNVLSLRESLSFSPVYQGHPVISETKYPDGSSGRNNMLLSDYRARKLDLTSSTSLSFLPFSAFNLFSQSSLSWRNSMKIIRTEFSGTADEPDWDYNPPEWDAESFTQNSLNLVIAASELSNMFSQSLSMDLNLPPLLGSFSWSLSLKQPYCTNISLSGGYSEESSDSGEWVPSPLNQSSSWAFFDNALSISQSFIYNIEESYVSRFSLGLTWKKLQFNFNMNHSYPYTLEETGWEPGQDKVFQAEDMKISYSWNDAVFYAWKDRISFSPKLSTQLSLNLVRPTESSFSLTASFDFNINEVFDMSFSASSRNSSVFKYVQNLSSIDVEIPGEKNLFVDLFDSFAFWDDDLRKKSAFKLQSLSIKMNHDLHDWKLSAELSVSPRLIRDTKPYRFEFDPYFKLSVVWKPLSTMTTTIVDEYGEFVLNPEK
ncbi:MAG: hypothetical protein K5930_00310 [Treponemataceae bacterium]|nr:hypothetical protein [Treponemataceae bacterium]